MYIHTLELKTSSREARRKETKGRREKLEKIHSVVKAVSGNFIFILLFKKACTENTDIT
jgi:hypothetical protein